MAIRLIILLVLLAGLVGYLVLRPTGDAPPANPGAPGATPGDDGPKGTVGDPDEGGKSGLKTDVWQLPLPGEQPKIEPEFDVAVRVDREGGKTTLAYDVNERHGLFVVTLVVRFYFTPPGGRPEDEVMVLSHYINDYIPVNASLSGCVTISPGEVSDLPGGDMGESDNWRGEVVKCHDWRREAPPDSWEGYRVREVPQNPCR
jgi:hypothetical protein